MVWAIPLLVAAGIVAGPMLAKIRQVCVRRTLGWLVLAAAVVSAHFILTGYDPILRMVGICCVLLGGMKGLVYAEWEEKLSLGRYLAFALLWFGMDPGSFRTSRRGLSWKPDVWMGLALMLVGTLGTWLVWAMGWRHILVMFVPMSIGFHFGALRVLKGGLRAGGFPVRTLFPNVLEAQGLGDFWSRRWNVGYSQMMQRLVGRPVENIAGSGVALMAIFLASGVLHELAITLPVRSGYGLPTLYFALQGVMVLVERKLGRPLGKIPGLIIVALPMGLLFPPAFQSEIIARCLGVFDLVKAALAQNGL